jgi:hypothetical protein
MSGVKIVSIWIRDRIGTSSENGERRDELGSKKRLLRYHDGRHGESRIAA